MKQGRYNIDIKYFLPHRPPMLMATTTPFLGPDAVETVFTVSESCIFVNKNGYLSEAGLIENAAQACSAITGQKFFDADDLEGKGNKVVGYISAIKKVELFLLPKIGDVIVTKASLVSEYDSEAMSVCTIEASTFRNDDLVVNCTLNFLIHEVE